MFRLVTERVRQSGTAQRLARHVADAARNHPAAARPPLNFWQRRTLLEKVVIGAGGVFVASLAIEPWRRTVFMTGHAVVRFTRSVTAVSFIIADYSRTLKHVRSNNLSPEQAAQERSACHQRSAERLLRLFQKNGGVYIKAGQHIASMYLLLPSEYTTTMRVLQDAAPTREYSEIVHMFEEDLGGKPEDIFSYFDPKPLAAASLAQVHRAVLKDGREVAVKVQYPGLREESTGDVITIGILIRAAKWMFPEFQFMWLEREFHDNLPKELDFMNEAHNNERVWRMLSNENLRLRVPKVYWPWTSHRILVMEFCHGLKVNDREGLLRMGVSPNEVATMMTRLFSSMIFIKGYVHCDPHPGNVLVEKVNGRPQLILLDHGLYRDLDEEFRVNYCHLWKALITHNVEQIAEYSKRLGVEEYQLFSSMLTARDWNSANYGLSGERTAEEARRMKRGASKFFKNITEILAKVPPPLLLLFKTNDLLRSINTDLGASINPFVVMAEYVLQGIEQDELRQNSSLRNRFRVWREHVRIWLGLRVYRTYLYFANLLGKKPAPPKRSRRAVVSPDAAAAAAAPAAPQQPVLAVA